jgi:hypothetical protein
LLEAGNVVWENKIGVSSSAALLLAVASKILKSIVRNTITAADVITASRKTVIG